jgi:CheY-like chemotaxis protein
MNMAQQAHGAIVYRALVVDDEPAVRNLTIRALASEGIRCQAAADGLEAKDLLRDNHYDVVVTDMHMPGAHGYAMTTELLQQPDRPVVIVLTGVLEPRLTRDLLLRGADDVMFKPVDYGMFAAKLKALVQRRTQTTREQQPAILVERLEADDHEEAPCQGPLTAAGDTFTPSAEESDSGRARAGNDGDGHESSNVEHAQSSADSLSPAPAVGPVNTVGIPGIERRIPRGLPSRWDSAARLFRRCITKGALAYLGVVLLAALAGALLTAQVMHARYQIGAERLK